MQAKILTPPATPVKERGPPTEKQQMESAVKDTDESDAIPPESPPLSSTPING